jgi:hypothetical protein
VTGPVARRARLTGSGNVAGVQIAPAGVGSGELTSRGFVWLSGPFSSPADAWRCADGLIDSHMSRDADLEVIGNFLIPPVDGPPSRDFQTLHFEFGLPLEPAAPADVACFTALHVSSAASPPGAVTRLVPVRTLHGGHPWPDRDELARRFAAYARAMARGSGAAGTAKAVSPGSSRRHSVDLRC